ncbi:Type 1 phosphatases regulator YPI1 [Ceratocystis fimbriata CBS 114723]|uniref:Type 1 phosphatases regulator n=1 Tax=Ceratocystis fimbriata CBS 114723 TaxID=1035309 RepID=A0A2C5WAJ3_9PEZI|nr:Type 1 phosphatases regulator YPI1 [Ceratocystis fimbriata CBS 114723]
MSASRHPNPSQYASHGSRTHTITTSDSSTSSSTHAVPSSSAAPVPERHAPAILRLRGAPPAESRSVQWAEDVVDNEHLNRKKSKICCIYHRPRGIDEPSSESSSSDSDSNSESDSDFNDADRPRGRDHRAHKHSDDCNHRGGKGNGDKKGKGKAPRKPSPNAYERQPKPHNLKGLPRKS